jgi:hypothetical protein
MVHLKFKAQNKLPLRPRPTLVIALKLPALMSRTVADSMAAYS